MRVNITMPIETLARIIVKAREMEAGIDDDDETDVEDGDEESPEDEAEFAAADEDDEVAEELEDDELTALLGSLSDSQLAELLALIWVGGGDYDEESWDEALSRARALSDQDTLAHLLGADDLSDLIEDGLVELGYAVVIEDSEAAA
jgi:hypothetical protein